MKLLKSAQKRHSIQGKGEPATSQTEEVPGAESEAAGLLCRRVWSQKDSRSSATGDGSSAARSRRGVSWGGRAWDHTDLAASWAPPHAGQPRAHSQPLRTPLGAAAGINEVLVHRAHQLPASACWSPLIVLLCLILLVPLLWFSSIVHQNIALFWKLLI